MRDEAAMLGGCLASLEGNVDEIVVVDTGSKDATRDIAASLGARLLRFEWTDDFSAARNHALDAATGDWILYIDADERLTTASDGSLAEIAAQPGHAAFQLKFRPRVGYSPYYELRLFRADPRIRFEGRIHERVMPSIQRVCASDGLRIGRAEATIQHLGYEGAQGHKHARNLPLLRRAVQDDPDRVYLWWHLGDTLAASGEKAEAETALREAIATAERTGWPRNHLEATLAFQSLARLYLDTGEPARAMEVLDEGLARRPGDPVQRLLKGRALIDLGRFSEAGEVLSGLPLDDPERFLDPDLACDLRVFGEWAFDLLGLAAFRQGHFAEARDAYDAAAKRSSEPEAYRARAAVAAMRART